MPDNLTPEQRARSMSGVRSRGNQTTEVALAALLTERGITGWELHGSELGRPDFVFHAERIVIFVDGCFWHACPTCYRVPTTNQPYWAAKAARNRRRDRRVSRQLRASGWRVLRVWEHAIPGRGTIARIERSVREARNRYGESLMGARGVAAGGK